jgi:hypothetical protein
MGGKSTLCTKNCFKKWKDVDKVYTQLLKTIPKMARAAGSIELNKRFYPSLGRNEVMRALRNARAMDRSTS